MNARKTAIVTGSATGVGAASALALARKGYDVVINYTKSEREARETERACRAAGADVMCLRADVALDTDCKSLVDAAIGRWKRLDALVNNAGITTFVGGGSWDTLDAEIFQRIFAVNLLGTFQMVRASLSYLKAARGAVVNISSVAGALGIGSSVPYIASKGAINSLTLHLARVLAPEIRVNAVCPGMITTRWFVEGIGKEAYEKSKAHYEASVPLASACSAEDVADAVVWLIEGARTTTGELLMLDSGMHLGTFGRAYVPPKT